MLPGLLDLVYPPVCLACMARTASPDALLCPACAATLADADLHALAAHLHAPATDDDSTPAATSAGGLDGAWARWRYAPDGALAPLVHALKYGQRPRYGRVLGRSLAAYAGLAGAGLAGTPLPLADALVPLPLHRARWLERGYNQSEEIAHGLAEGTGLPVRADLLRRAMATATQTRRGRADRAANVAHAFEAAPEAVGLRLLLVDDVVTTGATAHAAAAALKAAGAAWVGLVAVAWTE